MKLICPNCNQTFDVDGAQYASLLSQVRNKEFEAEVQRRLSEAALRQEAEAKAAKAQAIAECEKEISALKERLAALQEGMKHQVSAAVADRDKEIADLKSRVALNEADRKLAVLTERSRTEQQLRDKDDEISRLNSQLRIDKSEAELQRKNLVEQYEIRLNSAKDEIERIKDFRTRMSTKMIGESLEQFCSKEFNRVRPYTYPTAYFEKDNDASGGTKGDFIFRDYIDGVEYVSIMFEMKNEADTTATKHKNEDFFAKLDKDRRDKKCEYAVLVSMLEADNDLYNEGIVDVSYRYDKMFVVRPQFFMPLIGLLTQASKKSVQYIRELQVARNQNIDITNFEAKVEKFKDAFGNNVRLAVKNHDDAIAKIDVMIKGLQSIKEMFEKSNKYLTMADRRLDDDFTVRKLTHNNPTMKAMFEQERRRAKEE